MEVKTNKAGRNFLEHWGLHNIVGVEVSEDNKSRNEQTVIVRSENGLIALVVPNEDSDERGVCYFGSAERFAIVYSAQKAGITLQWNSNDFPIWPVWYERDFDKLEKFHEHYISIMRKYVA